MTAKAGKKWPCPAASTPGATMVYDTAGSYALHTERSIEVLHVADWQGIRRSVIHGSRDLVSVNDQPNYLVRPAISGVSDEQTHVRPFAAFRERGRERRRMSYMRLRCGRRVDQMRKMQLGTIRMRIERC